MTTQDKKRPPSVVPFHPKNNNNSTNTMVQIHCISVAKQNPTTQKAIILSSYNDNSTWLTWFYLNTVREFSTFFTRFLCERTSDGIMQQVQKDKFTGYVFKRLDGLTVVLITDEEYPARVGFDLCRKIMYDFSEYARENQIDWNSKAILASDGQVSSFDHTLKQLVTRYQDPTNADGMLRLKKELDATKADVLVTLDKLLHKGETLNELVRLSDDISVSGKQYYEQARRNKCACSIL